MTKIPLSSVNSEVKYTIDGLNTVTQANYQSDDIVRGHFLYSLTYDYSDHNTRIYRSGTNQKNITYNDTDYMYELMDAGHTQTLTTMWQSYFNDSEWLLVGFDYLTPYYKAQYERHLFKKPTRWANSILCLPVNINDSNHKHDLISDFSKYKQITGLNELMDKVGQLNKVKLPKSIIDPYANFDSDYIPDDILKTRYDTGTVSGDANHVLPTTDGEDEYYDNSTTLLRSECGISSDGTYIFFAMNDNHRNLYVARFNASDIRNDLMNNDVIDISTYKLTKENSFIALYTDLHKLNFAYEKLFSFQGFGLDNDNNFYISSEIAQDQSDTSPLVDDRSRFIIKIPNLSNNPNDWEIVNLTNYQPLKKMYESNIGVYLDQITEFESIQVIGINDVLLTVAYHKSMKSDENTSKRKNIIYEITW